MAWYSRVSWHIVSEVQSESCSEIKGTAKSREKIILIVPSDPSQTSVEVFNIPACSLPE